MEPTVKNDLQATDIAINDIFMDLPAKYQSNNVIQDFAKAIAPIQQKKNKIKFVDMIPRVGGLQPLGDFERPSAVRY